MGSGEFDFEPLLRRFNFGFSDKFGVNFADAISWDTAPQNLANPNRQDLGKFGKFNLAFHVGDSFESVLKNRLKFANLLNLPLQNLIFMNQIHSDKICIIDEKFLGEFGAKFDKFVENNGKFKEFGEFNAQKQSEFLKIFPECDAMITNLHGVGLCVMVADCSPVLLLDKQNGAVGVAHAGRNGVMQKIVSKTALKMSEVCDTKIADLCVLVGANIKGECYEIGELNLSEFNKFKCASKAQKNGENSGNLQISNLKNFDMNLALEAEFAELGISKFAFSKFCTHCESHLYSYRRERETGRFCGFVVV